MNRILIRLAIIAVIILEVIWVLVPRHLQLPRSPETLHAGHAFEANPSETTKAVLLDQIRRDVAHNVRSGQIFSGVLLLIDFITIYFFWNQRVTKPAA